MAGSRFSTDEADLRALPPGALKSYRDARYTGADLGTNLEAFAPPDREVLKHTYGVLIELDVLLGSAENRRADIVADFTRRVNWSGILGDIRSLGHATYSSREASPALRRIVHDIKGGPFQPLSACLQLAGIGEIEAEDAAMIYYLNRDCLKVMRNLLRDIDEPRRVADVSGKAHHVGLLVEKWKDGLLRGGAPRGTRLDFVSFYDGNIADSCLEFSTLERLLYNLINNAVRHAIDGLVGLRALSLDDDQANLRFMVFNRITSDHADALRQSGAGREDLGHLFRDDFTTHGTGLGLGICAEITAHAYGLLSVNDGIAGNYIRAMIQDDTFLVYFHWPATAA